MKGRFIFLLNILACLGCFAQVDTTIYAHRGFRGLSPENTIPAMLRALDLGADVLEMDIAFSADKQAIVSHDPWMDSLITSDPQGRAIASGRGLPLYEMAYAAIRAYDVGSKQHSDFPKQRSVKAYIPRLIDLIDSVEQHAREKGYTKPWYSIETKTSKARDHKAQPAPEEFVRLLMQVVEAKGIRKRVIIQSFDERTLEIIHRDYPDVLTMINIGKGTLEENLARLTFVPDFYAPIPQLIDEALVQACKERGIKLLCGNVNDKQEIDRVLNLGVTAFCTDYPYTMLP
ncbi:glycerophosphodiester phosphodiesterase family protein [Sphingobacterium sp. LRF_L2]|uniref:glycerophosphodiester phosphodiesterase family protein n=1 Tax=Sphingobacterium sp. LRF_L2 TaxID=3369421 RepID=UPI003F61A4CE